MDRPNYITTIPYYETDSGKRDVLKKCLASLSGKTLVLAGKQKTLPTAWNMCCEIGFSIADYVILSNDDIELVEGNLEELCIPNAIVSPKVNGGFFKTLHFHIVCIHKSVWEKVGQFDENFWVWWSDTDYSRRIVDIEGIDVVLCNSVNVLHPEASRTIKHNPGSVEIHDEEHFKQKWGRTYIDPIVEFNYPRREI